MLFHLASFSALAVGALAATSSTTMTGLVWTVGDDAPPDGIWDGSIVSADASKTIYALSLSGSKTITPTVTAGPSTAAVTQTLTTSGTTAEISSSCTFLGSTAAACTIVYVASAKGFSTSTTSSATYTETPQLSFYEVHITAGATKLPSTTSSSKGGVAPMATGVVAGLMIPGAALLAALI